MKYRIKEVNRNGISMFYPQVRIAFFWCTLEQEEFAGTFELVEYNYEDAMEHIAEHRKDYAKESVIIHKVV